MLHYVYQPLTVCLLFGTEQVVYSVSRVLSLKTGACNMRVRVNQNVRVVGQMAKLS